jgi:hypothetical protein
MSRDSFFIGWSPRSVRPLLGFLASLVVLALCGLTGLSLALGSRIDDPGGGDWIGEATLSGVLVENPYPILIADADATHPNGHAVLLSGEGKIGVQDDAARLVGQRVEAVGALVRRGTIEMLVVGGLRAVAGPAIPPAPVPLGTWRLTGEICDGKCVAGVMRPGNGLAHKACANICIEGGVPPVLVTTAPVDGARFLLMGDLAGRAVPDAFRDHVGAMRRMDGAVERIADLLIFRTDVAKAVVP